MFASKQVWYLPFALLLVTFLLYATIGLCFTEWISARHYYRPPNAFDNILSPETVDALYEDARLHRALLELTEAVAKVSSDYGEKLNSKGLEGFGKNLTEEVARIKAARVPKRKRGFLEDLGNTITGGGDGQGQQGGSDVLSSLGSLLSGGTAGNSTGGLGGLLSQGLSGIGNSIIDGLATPAFFLGIGLGEGAQTGLNLTDEANSKAIATRVVSAMGQESTGINLIAQNLGSGLSSQIAPSLGNGTTDIPIGMAAFALAQGIGQGTASGLNLTQKKFQPTNNSDIMGIASNFGLGVSGPIAGSIDVNKLVTQAGAGAMTAQLPQIAEAAGVGLGQGASIGLGLMKTNMTSGGPFQRRQAPTNPSQLDVPGAVGNFTKGLSQSFLGYSDLGKLLASTGGGLNLNIDGTGLSSIASGAGKGFGEGLAIGLNATPVISGAVTSPPTSGNGTNQTQEQTAEEFVKGLVVGFLQSGGASFIGNALSSGSGGLTKSVDIAKAAEGAARGLAEGSINALSQAGGVQKALKGDFPKELAMNLPSLPPSAFNDSINGSAVSFARGLSGEGILLVLQLVNQGKTNSTLPPSRRSVDETGVVAYNQVIRRADNSSSTPLAIDSETLQSITQLSINTITCQGVGGLAAVGLGVMNSPALKMNGKMGKSPPLDNSTLAALPKDPITITSEANSFTIKIQEGSITINGLSITPFIGLTASHVILTSLAFFYFLPAYLALGALMRISVMVGHPFNETKNKKWRRIILLGLFTPTSIIGIILGIVGMGNSRHFHTAHGVFGLLALLFLVPTVATSIMRLGTTAPQPGPSAFVEIKQLPKLVKGPQKIHIISAFFVQQTLALGMVAWIQGFTDLRSISLCIVDAVLTAPIVVAIVNFVLFSQVSAMALLGLRTYLEQRIAKKEKELAKNGGADGTANEKRVSLSRNGTIRTFGFNDSPKSDRPPVPNRGTADLLGREDSKIGWPSNIRKFGDEGQLPDRVSPTGEYPFVVPDESGQTERVYNAKLGGFEDDRGPAFLATNYDMPGPRVEGDLRPSSDLDPQSRYISYSVFPPPTTAPEEGKPQAPQRYASFSRPLTSRPSGEEMRIKYESVIKESTSSDEQKNQYEYGYGYGR